MAKPWSDVESSEAYQALSPDDKAKARDQYFTSVVAPKVPEADLGAARDQFMSFTAPKAPPAEDSRIASVKQGMLDPVTGAAQMLTHVLPNKVVEAGNELNNWLSKYGLTKEIKTATPEGKPLTGAAAFDQVAKDEDAALEEQRKAAGRTGTDWYRILGNIVSPANAAVAAKTPTVVAKAPMLLKAGVAAGQGALSGSLSPVTSDENFATAKAKQIGASAGLGAAAPVLGTVAAKIIKPIPDDAVAKLTEAGISLTPGQILGGWWQRAEDAATSIPLIGDSIKNAQRRSIVSLNNATLNKALGEIDQKLPAGLEGNEALMYTRKALGEAYEDLLPKLHGDLHNAPPKNAPAGQGVTAEPKTSFFDELQNIRRMGANLPEQQRNDLYRIIDKDVIGKFTDGGRASGRTLKEIQETLGKEASNFATGGPYERTLAGGIKEVDAALRRMLEDVNPEHAAELAKINSGYAQMKISQRAASSVGAKDGIFTPAQYHNAVKAADKTKDKRAFAEGTALGQDLSGAAKSRLSPTLPDSGTATRALVEAGMLGGGAHMLSGGITPIAAALTVPAMYTQAGTDLMRKILMTRPAGAAGAASMVRGATPAIAAGAAPLSQLMTNTGQGDQQ